MALNQGGAGLVARLEVSGDARISRCRHCGFLDREVEVGIRLKIRMRDLW
jgi:hypothetical protein